MSPDVKESLCVECRGSGDCYECDGEGGDMETGEDCPACSGGQSCSRCDGTGTEPDEAA